MSNYLRELAALVLGAFVGTLGSLILAGQFDAWTFDWNGALRASASVAIMALVKGLAGRFRGDPETVSWRKTDA